MKDRLGEVRGVRVPRGLVEEAFIHFDEVEGEEALPGVGEARALPEPVVNLGDGEVPDHVERGEEGAGLIERVHGRS